MIAYVGERRYVSIEKLMKKNKFPPQMLVFGGFMSIYVPFWPLDSTY